jgi:hypothetical protein
MLERLWEPPWQLQDSLRLVAWLVIAPSVIVSAAIIAWKILNLDTTQLVIVGSAGYLAWACTGGAVVRPRGRFRELAMITAVVVLVLITVPMEWFAAADEKKHGAHGQDIAAGFGIAVLFVATWPPTLALVAATRGARRLARRWRRGG